MNNSSLQLSAGRQVLFNGPEMQYLLMSNRENTIIKKVQACNRRPQLDPPSTSVVALSDQTLTFFTVTAFTRDVRPLVNNCIDFTLLSRYCIVLHQQGSVVDAQSHQSTEASSLTIYELDTQFRTQGTMLLPLLVPQDAFVVAIDSKTQPALFYFAVVTSNKVLLYRHNNTMAPPFELVNEINAPARESILSAVLFSTPLGIMLVFGTESGLLHFWSMATQQFCLRCNPGVGPVTTVVVSKLSETNLFVGGQTGIVSHVKVSDIAVDENNQRTIEIARVDRIETPPNDDDDPVLSISFVRGCVHIVRRSSYMKQLFPDQRHTTAASDVYAMACSPNQQSVVWCSEQRGMVLEEW